MNTDNFNMLIEDENGKTKECSIIARWHDENDYVAYTDGSKTGEELDLFISKCQLLEDNTIKLEPIVDDKEWQKANDFLDKYLFDGDKL